MGLGVCLLHSLLVAGCEPASTPQIRTAHQVRYHLDWAWDDANRTADGTAWEVGNDLGYRVRVTRGYVTSYSMELVECPKDAATPVASLGTLLWSAVGSTAYAGHATGTPNPAAIRPMQVESLTAPTARQVAVVLLSPQTYCQLHYLVARAGREAPGLPADVDMVDASLHIDGTYQAPETTTDTPFTLHTAVAYGALFDHTVNPAAPLHVDTGSSATATTVRRHLGRIFDGVDFVTMTDRVIAGQVLKSLLDHVEVEIKPMNENA
jgi:hypothetical protein